MAKASDGDQAALYSVQVNAPRTDGSPGSKSGSLTPASFQLLQVWASTAGDGTGGILAGGGSTKR